MYFYFMHFLFLLIKHTLLDLFVATDSLTGSNSSGGSWLNLEIRWNSFNFKERSLHSLSLLRYSTYKFSNSSWIFFISFEWTCFIDFNCFVSKSIFLLSLSLWNSKVSSFSLNSSCPSTFEASLGSWYCAETNSLIFALSFSTLSLSALYLSQYRKSLCRNPQNDKKFHNFERGYDKGYKNFYSRWKFICLYPNLFSFILINFI